MSIRHVLVTATVALVIAGCSANHAVSPKRTASRSASPTRTSSPFCLDLNAFQVGVVVYRGDAGAALEGKSLDVKELRRKARIIAMMGDEMRDSAPPDIAKDFRRALAAIKKSASGLKKGSTVRDVVEPIYLDKKNVRAFDAVDKYRCH